MNNEPDVNGAEKESIKAAMVEITKRLAVIEKELNSNNFIIEDFSIQAAEVAMQNQDECLSAISSDARQPTDNVLGRLDKGNVADGFLVKAFTGENHSVNRIGRPDLVIKRPCLIILFLVQWDKINALFGNESLVVGGLLPRFLICDTGAKPKKINRQARGLDKDIQSCYNRLIDELLKNIKEIKDPVVISASEDAKNYLYDYSDSIIDLWESGEVKDIEGFAFRWAEQAWKIALLFHCATHGKDAINESISLDTAKSAVKLVEWYVLQQEKILSEGRRKKKQSKYEEVMRLFNEYDRVKNRYLYHGRRISPNAGEATMLLDEMVGKYLDVVEEMPPNGGCKTKWYTPKESL